MAGENEKEFDWDAALKQNSPLVMTTLPQQMRHSSIPRSISPYSALNQPQPPVPTATPIPNIQDVSVGYRAGTILSRDGIPRETIGQIAKAVKEGRNVKITTEGHADGSKVLAGMSNEGYAAARRSDLERKFKEALERAHVDTSKIEFAKGTNVVHGEHEQGDGFLFAKASITFDGQPSPQPAPQATAPQPAVRNATNGLSPRPPMKSGVELPVTTPQPSVSIQKLPEATPGAIVPANITAEYLAKMPVNTTQEKVNYMLAYYQSSIGGNWKPHQAAGIIGNGHSESGLNERIPGDGGAAFGVFQHHPDRRANYRRVFGEDMRAKPDFKKQVAFANWELNNTHKNAGDALRRSGTVEQATGVICRLFEAPAHDNTSARIPFARQAMARAGTEKTKLDAHERAFADTPTEPEKLKVNPDKRAALDPSAIPQPGDAPRPGAILKRDFADIGQPNAATPPGQTPGQPPAATPKPGEAPTRAAMNTQRPAMAPGMA